MNKETRISLDYDDYCDQPPENCIDTLEMMTREIPEIKVNLFTIAANRGQPIKNENWIERTKRLIDSGNVHLCVHGLFHTHQEFKNVSLDDAVIRIKTAERTFNNAGLTFLKVFKGPHWGINGNTYEALEELGYTHVFTHEDYRHIPEQRDDNIKSVFYNWNLKDKAPRNSELIVHGHTHNVCGNGMDETYPRLFSWVYNTPRIEWMAANET